ncbi:MAG: bifunctional oligoribonuclease/PAP phosphatase NrnA [Cytophagales bacterium]|nr:bifunctional oligoribonuclease/PAP phosphatase NrnA [Cytophagales bacterium]
MSFWDFINKEHPIVLIPHARPDADALGSALALFHLLSDLGYQAHVISPGSYPAFLSWMPAAQDVLIFSEQEQACRNLIKKAQTLICVDFSSPSRAGDIGPLLERGAHKKILIDHHPSPKDFADLSIWSDKAVATAQLVYERILSPKIHLANPAIASCLYAGILTDTGSFQHGFISPEVHRIVASLIEQGAQPNKIAHQLYGNHSEDRLRFLGFALSKCLHIENKYHTAYFVLREKEMSQFQLLVGDTEGLVNYALSIEKIVFGMLIKECPGVIKISFRSKGSFPANEIAVKHFQGGGHLNAAGGHSHSSIEEVLRQLQGILSQYESRLNEEAREISEIRT